MLFKEFIGGSYESQSPNADCERTVNWYPEVLESEGATSRKVLYPTPGVYDISYYVSASLGNDVLWQAGTGPGRAHFFEDDREFIVVGTLFLEVTSSGSIVYRGVVVADDSPATISSNGDGGGQLFITSAGNGYIFDLGTNTLSAVASMAGKANFGGYIDGYFVALDSDTSTLYVSALLDGTSWDTGNDFAQRTFGSDPWLSLKTVGRYVWLIGEKTTEVWEDTGQNFPLAPTSTGLIELGIVAPYSVGVMGDALVWLGQTKAGRIGVFRLEGFNPQRISSIPMEAALQRYPGIEASFGESYASDGHGFYLLSCDRAGITWVWDDATNLWHERGTWDEATAKFESWHPRHHALAFGKHRMLNSRGPEVFNLDVNLTTDVGGRLIRRVRRAPAITSEMDRVFYSMFQVDMEAGEPGLFNNDDTGPYGSRTGTRGVNPHAILRISNDAGKTWIAERMMPAGKIGEFNQELRWHRLGSARRRVFELVVTDFIPWRITNAYMDVTRSTAKAEANG